jgi:malonyl CoA-acyl carrier protein transacylase
MTNGAFLFPGQGSEFVGMGLDLYDTFPAARAAFNDAGQAPGSSSKARSNLPSTTVSVAPLASHILHLRGLHESCIDEEGFARETEDSCRFPVFAWKAFLRVRHDEDDL